MNVEEEVRSRRLDAVVEEALGNGVPADLEDRVLQRVRGVEAAPRRAWSAVAAITLLAGVLVVAVVAWLRSSRDGVTPLQDPQKTGAPTVIELLAPKPGEAAKEIDVPAGNAAARAVDIVRGFGADIVVVGSNDAESRVALAGLSWREAIEAIAIERHVGLAEYGSTLLLGVGQVPTSRARATFGSDVIRAVDALKILHVRGGMNFVVATERLGGRVRMDVRDRPWRTVLDAVAAATGSRIVGRGNVLALVRSELQRSAGARTEEPMAGPISLQGPGSLQQTVDSWLRVARAELDVDIDARIDVPISRFACFGGGAVRERIVALAEAVHADVRESNGTLHVEPRLANDTGITMTAENMSLRDLVMMSWMTQQPNVEIADGVDAKVTVFVANSLWFDVLRAAAVAAGRQFVRTEKGYRIE